MQIQEGIAPEFRAQATEIFWDAFRSKLYHALGPDRKAHAYFDASFQSEKAIIATEGERLLGIAGFDTGDGSLVSDSFSSMFFIYGFSAIWRATLLIPFGREHQKGSLHLDGIAVREEARGQGVGTALMHAIIAKARESGCENVYLEVVESNTRARALYEHLGFKEVTSQRFGLFSPFLKIRSTIKMVKSL